jgi:eukaryotic-like serine/threonine-protein kinase
MGRRSLRFSIGFPLRFPGSLPYTEPIMMRQEFAGYSIIRRLASGGMTYLYVAVDEQQHRVVIRRLKQDYIRDRRTRNLFFHGAEVLAKLHHPNLVRLIKAGYYHEEPFMILEYVEAQNLRELILQRSSLIHQNILSLMRQLAAGLSYMHLNGHLHLDVKPDNVLVRNDGLVVLVDFDLATPYKGKPIKMNPLPGTFAYLPPETLSKSLLDDQTDIYAFGVTCYEMLTGHKPFEGITPEDSKRMQIDPSIAPTRLGLHNVRVSAPLENLIFKCLAKRKESRYPSMSLVARDLEMLI